MASKKTSFEEEKSQEDARRRQGRDEKALEEKQTFRQKVEKSCEKANCEKDFEEAVKDARQESQIKEACFIDEANTPPAGSRTRNRNPPPKRKRRRRRSRQQSLRRLPSRGNIFYITTAIAYPNGVPHIGHAYEAIATDALARFARLDGKDVFFLTGTDEHGLKMIQTAEAEKLPTLEVATRNALRFKEMDQRLNVSFDRFIRTTEQQHHRSSQEIWKRMAANGDIYLDSYAGWYSVRDEAYYAEDETIVGEDKVRRGPQGTPVEWVEEKSYFFKLSAYQDRLLAALRSRSRISSDRIRASNEVVSFVKGGLRDLSISRTTFDWGVKVPSDPEHVMYVWVDALTNYITGVGFPDENDANWRYWPADVHIIGKDIIRFHAVYWPAFLMSAGIPVQKRVYAHGFLFSRGEKMSKSVGNVVDPFNLADQYGVDQVRYFFLREVPFGQDGNYNHEAIVARINADLANDLGNLAQRSLSMISKQLGGVLPEPGAFSDSRQGDPGAGRRHDRIGANRDGDAANSPGAQCRLGRRRRGQPLFRGRGAVGAGEDRSAASANGAVRDRGGGAPDRHPDPAGDAGILGQAARHSRHSRRCAGFRRFGRRDPHQAGHDAARAGRNLSALCRTDRRLNRWKPCLSTAIAISIFRISPTISMASWREPRPPASGASSPSRRG